VGKNKKDGTLGLFNSDRSSFWLQNLLTNPNMWSKSELSLLITDYKKFQLEPISLLFLLILSNFKNMIKKTPLFFCSENSGLIELHNFISQYLSTQNPIKNPNNQKWTGLIRPVHFWLFGFLIAKSILITFLKLDKINKINKNKRLIGLSWNFL
jgi:hypothetical protein